MVLAGQIEEVARYCESDVLNTYRVWLVYELFRGSITAKELEWSEMQIRDFVVARKAANPHLYAAAGITKAGEEQPQNNSATSKLQAISIIRRRKWNNRDGALCRRWKDHCRELPMHRCTGLA
jgi:hypothetical protein